MNVYYLKFKTPKGRGYHRVVAKNQTNAIKQFIKGTTYKPSDVYIKKRVKKEEKRNYIPPTKRK